MRSLRFPLLVVVVAIACGGQFAPQTLVASVRIIVTRSDKPFAKPGDTVSLEALVVDQRPVKARPMKNYWIPFACTNPRDDLYYACFSALTPNAGPPGTTGMGLPGFLRPGSDITGFLRVGATYDFMVPADIISSHPPAPGADAPYGLSIVFFIACAGRVKIANIDPTSKNPQLRPIQCTDDDGNELSPDDWVFAFTRVYAYETLTNANPVISAVTLDGNPVTVSDGITVAPCMGKKCTTYKLGADVPDSSWEPSRDQHEAIYSTFYYTEPVGDFDSDGRVIFDGAKGKIDDHAVTLTPKAKPGEGTIWIIVQDTRGGATWVELPVHVK